MRIKQLPKGKRARRLKKKERTANLTGAQERRGNRESGEARSDLGTRFAAIRREIKQNPTNSNRGSEMYRNLRKTRIHLLVGAQRGGSDQSKQKFGQECTETGRRRNPQRSSAPQRGTKTRNPAPKPHNSAEFPGISTPSSPRRRRRSPASDRPRIAASLVLLRGRTRRDPSTPAELFPPPLPLGCSLFLLLALLGLSSFVFISLSPLLPPCSPLRPPPWFFLLVVEVRGAVLWVGKTPQNQPPS